MRRTPVVAAAAGVAARSPPGRWGRRRSRHLLVEPLSRGQFTDDVTCRRQQTTSTCQTPTVPTYPPQGPTMNLTTAPSSNEARPHGRGARAQLGAIFRTARLHPRQRSRGRRAGQPRSGLLRSDDGRRAVPHPRPAGARRRRRHPAPVVRRQPRHGSRRRLRWLDFRPGCGPERVARRRRRRAVRPGLLQEPQTIATSSAGRPTAELIDGMYVVRGARWASVSGCTSADFVGGMVVTAGPGDHSRRAWCCNRHAAAAIEPTWDTLGLRATASHHVNLGDHVEVPAWRTFRWPDLAVTRPGILANATTTIAMVSLAAAAVQLGAARRAIEVAAHLPNTNSARSRRRD